MTGYSPLPPGVGWVIVLVIIIGFAIAIAAMILGALFIYKVVKSFRGPQIRGPALTGRARVLWVKPGLYVGPSSTSTQGRLFKIALRVEVRGRDPYDVTFTQAIGNNAMAAMQPNSVVPVLIDSTNPRNVRIDFSQSFMPTGAGSSNVEVLDLRQGASRDGAALANQIKVALAGRLQAGPGDVQFSSTSSEDLLVSGQRVPGVLKSFADTGSTPRSLGQVPSRPEFIDDPLYMFDVALQFPNLPPVDARAVQRVPRFQVPNLAIGMELVCAVDHADPAHRFIVDWDNVVH